MRSNAMVYLSRRLEPTVRPREDDQGRVGVVAPSPPLGKCPAAIHFTADTGARSALAREGLMLAALQLAPRAGAHHSTAHTARVRPT